VSYLIFLIFSIIGFFLSYLIAHPNSPLNKHLPKIDLKIIQLSPSVKIILRKRTIHLHHWMYSSILLVITITLGGGILDTLYSKGFLLGGIVQGITFSDWKQIIVKGG